MQKFGQQGIALVEILFLTSILLAIAAFTARSTRVEIGIARNDYLQKQALQVAEAGLDHVWRKIEAQLTAGVTLDAAMADPTGFLGTGSDQSLNGISYRFVPFGGGSGNGYYVRLDSGSDDPGPNRTSLVITSIGSVPGSLASAQREVRAFLQQSHAFDHGLFAKYNMTINGTGSDRVATDSYNSSLGAYQSPGGYNGSVGANGNISNTGQPEVHGSATAGGTVDLTPDATGGETGGAPQLALPPVTPCNTTMGYTASNDPGVQAPGNDFRSNSISANSHDNVILSAGTYCFNSVTLSGQSTITVTGAVKIYLTGASDFTGGGVINNVGSPPLPANLQIYSSCSAAAGCGTGNNGGLKLTGGTNAYFSVYAPDTNIKFNSNTGNIYGAIIGGNIDLGGGANFHYDEALNGTGPLTTALVSWHEVRH